MLGEGKEIGRKGLTTLPTLSTSFLLCILGVAGDVIHCRSLTAGGEVIWCAGLCSREGESSLSLMTSLAFPIASATGMVGLIVVLFIREQSSCKLERLVLAVGVDPKLEVDSGLDSLSGKKTDCSCAHSGIVEVESSSESS